MATPEEKVSLINQLRARRSGEKTCLTAEEKPATKINVVVKENSLPSGTSTLRILDCPTPVAYVLDSGAEVTVLSGEPS